MAPPMDYRSIKEQNHDNLESYTENSLLFRAAGGDAPRRKYEKNANELLGLKIGTACPAPLNVAKVTPLYS
jgi:hypothetical protein